MLAQDNQVIISVSDCHAVISRYRRRPDGTLVCERATNAEDLEGAAIRAVVAQGTSITTSTHYPCPAELARQAQWN